MQRAPTTLHVDTLHGSAKHRTIGLHGHWAWHCSIVRKLFEFPWHPPYTNVSHLRAHSQAAWREHDKEDRYTKRKVKHTSTGFRRKNFRKAQLSTTTHITQQSKTTWGVVCRRIKRTVRWQRRRSIEGSTPYTDPGLQARCIHHCLVHHMTHGRPRMTRNRSRSPRTGRPGRAHTDWLRCS